MATHDYVIDNSTGANVRADINSVLQAILTNNSSSSAPSTTAAYMFWADTTSGTLKIRNSSDNAWVELLQLDGTLTLEDGSVSAPGLAFRDDLNTGIFSSAADTFNVATAGVERMELGATTIFNEDGADVDFRIESDSNANMFFLDAGNNRLSIGANSGSGTFNVTGVGGGNSVELTDATNSTLRIAHYSGAVARIAAGASQNLALGTGFAEKMRIDTSGNVGIGTTSPVGKLDVRGTGSDFQGLRIVNTQHNASVGSSAQIKLAITNSVGERSIRLQCTEMGNNVDDLAMDFYTGNAASNNSESLRMRIDSSGRVLIGTTTEGESGADDLTIENTSTDMGITLRSATNMAGNIFFSDGTSGSAEFAGFIQYQHDGNHMKFGTNTIERMRIDSSGNVGIGTTSPTQKLDVDGNLKLPDDMAVLFGVSDMAFVRGKDSQSDGFLKLGTGGLERARIDSSGHFFFSGMTSLTASSSNKGVNIENQTNTGRMNFHANSSAGTALNIAFFNSGNHVGSINTTSSSTSYGTSSDYRLKENVTAISDGITRLKTLKPSRFNFKADATTTVDGFLAHEVTAVPEAIIGTKDEVDSDNNPVYQSIDQSKLVPLLVAAVKELITKVEALEAA